MSRRDNKYGYSSFTEEELKKYLKLLIVPAVVILLVLAIIFAERLAKSKNGGDVQVSADSPETTEVIEITIENGEGAEGQEGNPVAESGQTGDPADAEGENQAFAKDEVLEVNALIESYFTAKQSADVETIYRLFGRQDTEGMEELQNDYRYTARYTDGYENIVCYTRPGPVEGSYLAYVSYDLKFKNVETPAPGLFRVYIITNEEGALQMVDSSLQDQVVLQDFSDAEKTDELILLRTQVYAKLRQALETDPDLAGVYGVLQKNSSSGETQESKGESNVSIVTGGGAAQPEPAPETAAE